MDIALDTIENLLYSRAPFRRFVRIAWYLEHSIRRLSLSNTLLMAILARCWRLAHQKVYLLIYLHIGAWSKEIRISDVGTETIVRLSLIDAKSSTF